MDGDSPLPWLLIALFIFSAMFFAMADAAFSLVGRTKLKAEMDRGNRKAQKALVILDRQEKAEATMLIGSNVAIMLAASVVTVMVVRSGGALTVLAAVFITAPLAFFLGQMLPRNLAERNPVRFCIALAPALSVFIFLLSPLSYAVNAIGKAAALRSKNEAQVTVTEDELYDIIETMKDEGELDPERGNLVHSALAFADVNAESIVTPRVDTEAIDIETTPAKVLEFVKASRHSRFPVYSGSIDNIVGVLQIRRFIKAYMKQGDSLNLASILDETHFTHQSTKIDELLSVMSRKRLNMAVITDNYGGTLGIVTVEDILEELVGDIWDEDDDIKESVIPLADGGFALDPELSVEEALELIDFEDSDDFDFENKLLGEWAFENFERIPAEGESFIYNGLKISVAQMRANRIVLLHAHFASDGEGGGER